MGACGVAWRARRRGVQLAARRRGARGSAGARAACPNRLVGSMTTLPRRVQI